MTDGENRHVVDALGKITGSHYAALTDALWIIDQGQVNIHRYQIGDASLTSYPLPKNWQDFSLSALSSNGEYLFFGVKDTPAQQNLAVIWQTETQSVVAAYPVSGALIQPYIDSKAHNFIALAENGDGIKYIADDFARPQLFKTMSKPTQLALG